MYAKAAREVPTAGHRHLADSKVVNREFSVHGKSITPATHARLRFRRGDRPCPFSLHASTHGTVLSGRSLFRQVWRGESSTGKSAGAKGPASRASGTGQVETPQGLLAHSRLRYAVPVTAALAGQGPGPAGVGVGAHGRRGAVREPGGHACSAVASLPVETGFQAGGR